MSSAAERTGDIECENPVISANGRFVAFNCRFAYMVAGRTVKHEDVFVRDLVAGITERMNVNSRGQRANSFSGVPAISANGRYVAFQSAASNFVAEDTNRTEDVFVRDRIARTTTLVSIADK